MRGVGRAVVAIAIAAAVVLAPSPALAVQPPPPPVAALPVLPSTATKALTNFPSVGGDATKFMVWLAAAMKQAGTTATGAPKPVAVPLTGPSPLAGLVASPAGAALNGWFAIAGTGAAVKFVGQVTDANFENAMCGLDSWVQTGYGWLTMGQGPGCSASVAIPNSDVVPGTTLTYNGSTWKIVYTYSFGSPMVGWAYCTTGPVGAPAGTQFALQKLVGGVWQGVALIAATTGQYGCSGRAGATGQFTADPATYGDPPRMGIRRNSDGAILAQQQTTNSDPTRSARCSIEWEDGSTTSAAIGTYTDTGGFPIGGVDPACTEAYVSKPGHGPGLLPSEIKIGSTNTETGAQTEIAGQEVPDFTEEERAGLDPGDGTGLKLWKITAAGKGSCMTWAADCRGWWTKTDQATKEDVGEGTKYRCEFGGKKVKLAECGVYRNTFEEQTDKPGLTDPEDGQEKDWKSELDSPGNSTDPGTGITPGDKCFSEWGEVANPIEWVLQPVKCALVWAFVPRTTVVTATTTGITTAWQGSSMGQWSDAVTGWSFIPPPSGCEGLVVPIGDIFGHGMENIHILEACPGDTLQPLAIMSSIVIGVMAVIGLIWVATGSLGGIVGFRGLNGGGS